MKCRTRTPLAIRFWKKVKIDPAGCFEWLGAKMPYGVIRNEQGKNEYAHRVSWRLHTGNSIPEGMDVLHHCDNPSCVRFDHLFLGTDTDNQQDAVRKGRHRRGERHHAARLKESEVQEIKRRHRSGEAARALAREFGVSRGAVNSLLRGRSWKGVG